MTGSDRQDEPSELKLKRWVAATPERVWRAWTEAREIKCWWGPSDVRCIEAEIDLRTGGRYRIGNRLPDGQEVWIDGRYETVDRPHRLRFSWRTDLDKHSVESVDVRFRAVDGGTEICVVHRRIPTRTVRDSHERGWTGCLEGIAKYVTRT